MLTIGIPKNRHVLPGILKLFDYTPFGLESVTPSLMRFQKVFAVQLVFIKPRRLAILTTRGRLDAAIMGQDVMEEHGSDLEVLAHLAHHGLGLRQTRVVVYADAADDVQELRDIPDRSTILSEYPRLTQDFFGRRDGINVIPSPGNTEAEIPLLHRFGVSVVDSGNTLKRHSLKEVGTIFNSTPVLVRSGYMPISAEKLHVLLEVRDTLRDVLLSLK